MGRKEEIGTELHPVGTGESPAMEQGGRREGRESLACKHQCLLSGKKKGLMRWMWKRECC